MNFGRKKFYTALDTRDKVFELATRQRMEDEGSGLRHSDLKNYDIRVPLDADGFLAYRPGQLPYLEIDPPLPRQYKVRGEGYYTLLPLRQTEILTMPSKMAAFSFSLPAGAPGRDKKGLCPGSCPASVYDTGNPLFICNACYALGGRYAGSDYILKSQLVYEWTRRCLKEGTFVDHMVAILEDAWHLKTEGAQTRTSGSAEAGNRRRIWFGTDKFFRLHDSGDFFSPEYWEAWCEICEAYPNTLFWAPTRVALRRDGSPNEPWVRRFQNAPRNLVVRPSTLHFEAKHPTIPGLAAGTMCSLNKVEGVHSCPVYWSEDYDTCDDADCRVCWLNRNLPVSYPAHGDAAESLYKHVYGEDWAEAVGSGAALGDIGAMITPEEQEEYGEEGLYEEIRLD
jgi:hypothetical protein